jgi:hypothetical protein
MHIPTTEAGYERAHPQLGLQLLSRGTFGRNHSGSCLPDRRVLHAHSSHAQPPGCVPRALFGRGFHPHFRSGGAQPSERVAGFPYAHLAPSTRRSRSEAAFRRRSILFRRSDSLARVIAVSGQSPRILAEGTIIVTQRTLQPPSPTTQHKSTPEMPRIPGVNDKHRHQHTGFFPLLGSPFGCRIDAKPISRRHPR